jgi:site-specific DNA recombinase
VKANAEAGRPHGRVLFGYKRIHDSITDQSERVVDETTAPLVREIFGRFAAGESRRAIMADFQDRNIPTPTGLPTWVDITQLTRILTNPGYAGLRVHQGQVIGKAAWEPLIADHVWKRVQRQLEAKRRDDVRPGARRHHLTGIIERGVCGRPMNLLKTSVTRGAGRAYNCPSFHTARKQEPVDALVNAVIVERLSRPDAMAVLLNGTSDVQLGALLAEREALEVRFTDLVGQAASGAISPTMLGAIEKKLNEQMKALDGQIRKWSDAPTILADVIGAGAKEKWDGLHPTQQNDIARALFSSIRIMPAGKGKRIFDPNLVQFVWSS